MDKLNDWVYWKKKAQEPQVAEFFGKIGYSFPYGLATYMECLDRVLRQDRCPLCDGWGEVGDDDGTVHACICHVLSWQGSFQEERKAFGQRIGTYVPLLQMRVEPSMPEAHKKSLNAAIHIASSWVADPFHWVLFIGPNGVGKTNMLWAMLSEYAPLSIYMTSGRFEDLIHEYRRLDRVDVLVKALRSIPIFALDDWGMQTGGAYFDAKLAGVINDRYMDWQRLPTLCASNLLPEQMQEDNKRVASRFRDTQKGVLHGIQAVDYRTLRVPSYV